MNRVSRAVLQKWIGLGSRFLPFADVATKDLPLSRLLRLSLFQVAVGMALVLLIGTLNRVMIVELHVPASLVGVMISLPLVFAPFRALIGYRSDTHRSALGWRRVPFMYRGAMIQFGGFAFMPFALLVLSGTGNATNAPAWVGMAGAAFAFLLVGAGLHTVQTVGLALATDLATSIAVSADRTKGLTWRLLAALPCPLLRGERCSVYDARPLPCRAFGSFWLRRSHPMFLSPIAPRWTPLACVLGGGAALLRFRAEDEAEVRPGRSVSGVHRVLGGGASGGPRMRRRNSRHLA